MEPPAREKSSWALTLLFAGAATAGLALGIAGLAEGRLQSRSGGILSISLPWLGALFYGSLAALAFRSPRSPWLSRVAGFYVFVHACLVTESLRSGLWCPICLGVASLALSAGLVQAFRVRPDRITVALGLVLGAGASFFSPAERIDDVLTRSLWPARIYDRLPSVVDREEIAACGHSAAVRVFIYEKCKACESLKEKLVPRLLADYPKQVCTHVHELSSFPRDQRFPLVILLSRTNRVVVIEGYPVYEELRGLIESLARDAKGS